MSMPRFTRRPPEYQKSRNHGFLLTGLEAGLRILVCGPVWLVESSQLNGSMYPVLIRKENDVEHLTCWCDWGRKVQASWAVGSDVLPCTHQLLVFWYRLPAATRARLCDQDPNLVAAQLAGQAALLERGVPGGDAVITLGEGRLDPVISTGAGGCPAPLPLPALTVA
ncbi:MAG TPA: hypothetical protein VKY74_24045 [Chloroflexia bacterium]|nr:hypothetical protein [Chloroflexia bacterium]